MTDSIPSLSLRGDLKAVAGLLASDAVALVTEAQLEPGAVIGIWPLFEAALLADPLAEQAAGYASANPCCLVVQVLPTA